MPTPDYPNPSATKASAPAGTQGSVAAVAATEEGPVSIWLYLAGLCVTLSGLYAVNFGIEDHSFTMLTYGLAISGYLTSYLMRTCRLPLRALQVPLVIALICVFFFGLSGDRGIGWLAPPDVAEDRAKSLQLIFAWLAIIHTFTLTTDAAVLFACVPCMTMIALVSTTTTEPQVQDAFLLFICSATFLMVHENYLRTRMTTVLGRTPAADRRLFGGQVQLAAFCFFAALILANFVAVPIRTVGQRLFIPTVLGPMSASNQRQNHSSAGANIRVGEFNSVELATGPIQESETVLLRIHSDRGLYWRGTAYDYYTGHSFDNRTGTFQSLQPTASAGDSQSDPSDFYNSGSPRAPSSLNHFKLPESPFELPDSEMEGSAVCKQEVSIAGGVFTQFYGAGTVRELNIPLMMMQVNPAGNLMTYDNLAVGTSYQVTSQVPDNDPYRLRKSPAGDTPALIKQYYLQRAPEGQSESPRLQELAEHITHGLKTNYDKVAAIQKYIADTCKYNLQTPAAPRDQDIVEYFLFNSHQGYCDSFGAAMTMLCRYANIPARFVSGFLPGDLESDTYIVRQRHKHVWTEVFFPKVGWVSFDATEGAEETTPHTASKKSPNSFAAWFLSHGWLPPTIALFILGALLYLLKVEVLDRFWRSSRQESGMLDRPLTNQEIVRIYLGACGMLARHGYARLPAMTADEFAQHLTRTTAEILPSASEPLHQLTALYARFRYSRDVATGEDVQAARDYALTLTACFVGVKKPRRKMMPSQATAG
jgi:hypothetical protein